MRDWTTEDLQKYTSRFSDEMKQSVAGSLLCSDIINKFMSTTAGKVIFDTTIERITSQLRTIIELCDKGTTKNIVEIEQAALKMKIMRDFIHDIASMTLEGDKMKKAVKEANDKG
jgi:hypothetical protein